VAGLFLVTFCEKALVNIEFVLLLFLFFKAQMTPDRKQDFREAVESTVLLTMGKMKEIFLSFFTCLFMYFRRLVMDTSKLHYCITAW